MISEDQIVPYNAKELPVDKGPWLIFAPHADDESFGMGGTLAKAADKGMHIELVVMTDGALGGEKENLADIAVIRKQEAIRAAASLGLSAPVFLDNEDRGLTIDAITIAQVTSEINRVSPAAVFFPGVFELHPDHRTVALLVWRALREMGQPGPVPVGYEVLVQSPVNTLVDITSYIDRKESAMANYESQLAEYNYIEIALALNQLRSLTLSPKSRFAEGFYCYRPEDLDRELADVIFRKIATYF